ncbi:uncharacterized protein K452DRAFT_358506 [Aplosporella prunicola CBS 121167]|uniref:Uncharacterized protein n=1 Tax=Aplosporella prunicola CBS 121167 TaxID=1176127 RepID=A0A6A6BFE8_9PEZI|nr:uncharacterized protein K452DRAFT_358506 [Aplosporella prunicola CBS 121167]KAF2142035.1 hypothetical protein K452DRAFT_358506 [Aplosporella prunicola CBS 121167]
MPLDLEYVEKEEDALEELSLYRALARQLTGIPGNHEIIRNEVLHHFLRVWYNPKHPLHGDYRGIARRFDNQDAPEGFSIFQQLCFPDRANNTGCLDPVVQIITKALRICVEIYRFEADREISSNQNATRDFNPGIHYHRNFFGGSNFPICRLGTEPHLGSSLTSIVEKEDGANLIRYMLDIKQQIRDKSQNGNGQTYQHIEIKEARWWWDPKHAKLASDAVHCWNEHDSAIASFANAGYHHSEPPSGKTLKENRVFSNFTVIVKRPNEVYDALKLLKEALNRAPAQRVPVNTDFSSPQNKRELRQYVGIDAEFKTVSTTTNLDDGEYLVSVLSIAVDRHVTFMFYVLDMLQNPEDETVPALEKLFKETIFDPNLLKIWWNFQLDIYVIDTTIAHMYQKEPRDTYHVEDLHGLVYPLQEVQPTFKLTSPYFMGKRPEALKFDSSDHDCKMHAKRTDEPTLNPLEAYPRNIACPCRLGNIDLAALIGHIASDLGIGPEVNVKKVWRYPHFRLGYAKFLDTFLSGDWVLPILDWFKDAPARAVTSHHNQRADAEKTAWYRSLGPGMENDADKLGYNIGDAVLTGMSVVVGITLTFRFLTTTDDRYLLASRLFNTVFNGNLHTISRGNSQTSVDQTVYERSIPLIEDNPRLYIMPRRVDMAYFEVSPLYDAQWLVDNSYMAHEERCHQMSSDGPRFYAQPSIGPFFDPLHFTLSASIFTTSCPELPAGLTPPVVRKGRCYTDDLCELICDTRRQNLQFRYERPKGLFSAIQGQRGVYGASLCHFERVMDALNSEPPSNPMRPAEEDILHEVLRNYPTKLQHPPQLPQNWDGSQDQKFESASGRYYHGLQIAMNSLYKAQRLCGQVVAPFGKDLLDQDASDYLERIRATPEWNRPADYNLYIDDLFNYNKTTKVINLSLDAITDLFSDLARICQNYNAGRENYTRHFGQAPPQPFMSQLIQQFGSQTQPPPRPQPMLFGMQTQPPPRPQPMSPLGVRPMSPYGVQPMSSYGVQTQPPPRPQPMSPYEMQSMSPYRMQPMSPFGMQQQFGQAPPQEFPYFSPQPQPAPYPITGKRSADWALEWPAKRARIDNRPSSGAPAGPRAFNRRSNTTDTAASNLGDLSITSTGSTSPPLTRQQIRSRNWRRDVRPPRRERTPEEEDAPTQTISAPNKINTNVVIRVVATSQMGWTKTQSIEGLQELQEEEGDFQGVIEIKEEEAAVRDVAEVDVMAREL